MYAVHASYSCFNMHRLVTICQLSRWAWLGVHYRQYGPCSGGPLKFRYTARRYLPRLTIAKAWEVTGPISSRLHYLLWS